MHPATREEDGRLLRRSSAITLLEEENGSPRFCSKPFSAAPLFLSPSSPAHGVVQTGQALALLFGEVSAGLLVVGGLLVAVAKVKSLPAAKGTGCGCGGGMGGQRPV
jgi:hypothetical protein